MIISAMSLSILHPLHARPCSSPVLLQVLGRSWHSTPYKLGILFYEISHKRLCMIRYPFVLLPFLHFPTCTPYDVTDQSRQDSWGLWIPCQKEGRLSIVAGARNVPRIPFFLFIVSLSELV